MKYNSRWAVIFRDNLEATNVSMNKIRAIQTIWLEIKDEKSERADKKKLSLVEAKTIYEALEAKGCIGEAIDRKIDELMTENVRLLGEIAVLKQRAKVMGGFIINFMEAHGIRNDE